jgi:TfoX/Sxy family transcriptional regulator of competence genes
MAIDQKVDYSPQEQKFTITTRYDRIEMSLCNDPKRFTKEVEYQIACRVADKVMEMLSPAIAESIKQAFPVDKESK